MATINGQNAASYQRPLNRPQPKGPAQAYKTYGVEAPLETHWRDAGCEEVGCLSQHYGFQTEVDINTDLGKRQAYYITQQSGRRFTETQDGRPGIVIYQFPPGTECFAPHRIRISRPPLFIVRDGDWRKHLGNQRQHTSADSWLDDFSSHQDKLVSKIGR